VGPFFGSTYPNNSAKHNTLKAGSHQYNNKVGHKGGSKHGLNLINSNGERKSEGTDPQGNDKEMTYVNVHSGYSDENRGSEGCLTIKPDEASSFFENFDFSGANSTTGKSTGTLVVYRGETKDSQAQENLLQWKKYPGLPALPPILTSSDQTRKAPIINTVIKGN
jgi:hypothetical protein